MWLADRWSDYELIDSADGEKLERWGNFILRRPDPLAVWKDRDSDLWNKAHAWYHRSNTGGGHWEYKKKLPESWSVKFEDMTFQIKPMKFKHTGLFPEQAVNWKWFSELIKNSGREIKVLNLFAYTGGATVAGLCAGASVTHVDAAKGMVNWAKENVISSKVADRGVRYIVDDVIKFVLREQRRGKTYDAVIMDPPAYGRGPSGEMWRIENDLYPLVSECVKLMSDKPLFFLINAYNTGISANVLNNVLKLTMGKKFGGRIEADEIGIPMSAKNGMALPCGISGRWQAE